MVQTNYRGIREITERASRALPALRPTLRPFAGNDLGHKPSAGAAGGAPEAEAQGVTEQLATLAGAGRRRGIRQDLNATAGKGDAGQQGGAGGVIGIGGNPDAPGSRRLALLKPIGQGGDLGHCVVTLQQFRHGLRWWRSAGAADQQLLRLMQQLPPVTLSLLQAGGRAIEHHDQIRSGQISIGQIMACCSQSGIERQRGQQQQEASAGSPVHHFQQSRPFFQDELCCKTWRLVIQNNHLPCRPESKQRDPALTVKSQCDCSQPKP